MQKFDRNFILNVEGRDGEIHEFRMPFTLVFSIRRAALASANTGNFRLLNLNQDIRKVIYKDYYDRTTFRYIRLLAGYKEDLATIFEGNIAEAKSYRESGAVDFITEIDGYDWSFAMVNAESNWTLSAGVSKQSVINKLSDDICTVNGSGRNVSRGTFGTFSGTYDRGRTISGNSWQALQEETNGHCFIDNGKLCCLQDNEAFEGNLPLITGYTGLLSTPKKRENILTIETVFEPKVRIGQVIALRSTSETLYNGDYRVIGIDHAGTISGAVCGQLRTVLTLDAGEAAITRLSQ